MTWATFALLLSILSLTVTVIAQVHIRSDRAATADLHRALAAYDRQVGNLAEARLRDDAADRYARRTWPFRTRPAVEFEVPTGILPIFADLTAEQYAALKAKWETQLGQVGDRVHHTYSIPPVQRSRRSRRWWQW